MALFVPNPERESVEELIEDLAREIATRYRNAEDLLIREVAARAVREARLRGMLPEAPAGAGLTVAQAREQNRILAELAAERAASLRALQERAREVVDEIGSADLAQSVIALAAEEGSAAAAAQLGFAGRQRVVVGTATQAVASLVLDLESRFEVLNARLTRYPQDAYQRIVSLYSPNTLLGVTTSRVQQAQAVQRFLAEGIPGFMDRSGRTWTIGAYAEMAGRTSVNRAFNDAGIWRMGQAGIHLATVVRGLDSCRKCAAWAGKILSTDGSPAGVRELPHATGNGTVAVEVAGTVQDARNAGWNHPNCRCRLVPYLPGLTVRQADTTYDEAAEKERAEQRQLEREIRAAKRREASAMNDTDRRRAAREVREAQADMREFIARTGRHRQSYREQLGFSDGRPRSTTPRERGGVAVQTLARVRPGERVAQSVPDGAFPRPHELATGERLARVGIQAQWQAENFTPGVKNPDVVINGHLWDFKSPEGGGKNTISNQFSRAKEQGVRRFVLDLARSPLDEAAALAETRRRLGGSDWFTDVIFIDRSGNVTWLTRE